MEMPAMPVRDATADHERFHASRIPSPTLAAAATSATITLELALCILQNPESGRDLSL